MSTVHIANSKDWLPEIKERIAALEKQADEWHARETQRLRRAAEYKALSWWAKRGKPDPAYEYDPYPLRYWYVRQPFPMDKTIIALHSLVPAASLNLPLDVDTDLASLFLKEP